VTEYHIRMAGPQTAIYRSALPRHVGDGREKTGVAIRPPLYVPNAVDNLWEWRRPVGYPSRRMSAFASPTPELAQQGGPPRATVYQIDITSEIKVGQLNGYRDSRDHPEAVAIPILLYERLGTDWIGSPMEDKEAAGRLWLPCLSKAEVDRLFADVNALRLIRDEVMSSVRYWNDVQLLDPSNLRLDPEGEIFFEAPKGYTMRPVGNPR
jgi:hypothetical protein